MTKVFGQRTRALVDTGAMCKVIHASILPHKFNIGQRLRATIRIQALGARATKLLPVVRICHHLWDSKGYMKQLWINVVILEDANMQPKEILGQDFIK